MLALMRLLPLLSLLQLSTAFSLSSVSSSTIATIDRRQDQPDSTPMMLDEPACDHYKCHIHWHQGQHVFINWQNAPVGTVALALVHNEDGKEAYHIADVQSPSPEGSCDAGDGLGKIVKGKRCGRYNFTVPMDWPVSKHDYMIYAQLKEKPSLESYTDIINIAAPLDSTSNGSKGGAIPPSQTGNSTATAAGTVKTTPTLNNSTATGMAGMAGMAHNATKGAANSTGTSSTTSSSSSSTTSSKQDDLPLNSTSAQTAGSDNVINGVLSTRLALLQGGSLLAGVTLGMALLF